MDLDRDQSRRPDRHRGLPVCHSSEIDPGTSAEALAACGSALVGEGRYLANTAFPEQSTFPTRGRIVAFNSVDHGHPAILAHVGYLRKISLSLFRVFSYRGRSRSYLSAACAAPPGFPGAVFPFARASMAFEDGRRLSSTLTRSCRVSE